MKGFRLRKYVFVLLVLALSIGLSFIDVPVAINSFLYSFSWGIAVFVLLSSVIVSIAVINRPKGRIIFVGVTLVLLSAFDRFLYGMELISAFFPFVALIIFFYPVKKSRMIASSVVATACLVLVSIPATRAYGYLVLAIYSLAYAILAQDFSGILIYTGIMSYSVFAFISHFPSFEGARFGSFIPMIIMAIGGSYPPLNRIWRGRKRNTALAEQERRIAQIEERGLKEEIRPHFLLNTLNNIQVAYHEDYELGRRELDELIKMEKHIAQICDLPSVPIKEEVSIISYLVELFCLVWKKDITLEVQLENENMPIPPMILQPLVENSLQHSGILNQKDGLIYIRQREEFGIGIIEIGDNGTGRPLPSESRGIGLSNVKNRISLLDNGMMSVYSDEYGTSIEIRFSLNAEGVGIPFFQ